MSFVLDCLKAFADNGQRCMGFIENPNIESVSDDGSDSAVHAATSTEIVGENDAQKERFIDKKDAKVSENVKDNASIQCEIKKVKENFLDDMSGDRNDMTDKENIKDSIADDGVEVKRHKESINDTITKGTLGIADAEVVNECKDTQVTKETENNCASKIVETVEHNTGCVIDMRTQGKEDIADVNERIGGNKQENEHLEDSTDKSIKSVKKYEAILNSTTEQENQQIQTKMVEIACENSVKKSALLGDVNVEEILSSNNDNTTMDMTSKLEATFIGSEDTEWLGIFDEVIGIYNTVHGIHVKKQKSSSQLTKKEPSKEKTKGTAVQHLFAGGASGLVSRSATAPLDRLKVMLQVHSNAKEGMSMFKIISNMLKEGGVSSMWRGNGINCIKVGPESAIKFCMFEQIKQYLNRGDKDLRIYERFIAGAGSGIVANATIYPMETIKTKLAIGKTGEYKNIFDCGRKIFKQYGMKGFYKGMAPGLMGMIPYAGIDLCVFDTMKSNWLKSHAGEKPRLDPSAIIMCGATAGGTAQLASYPFGLIRTKLQAQSTDSGFTGVKANGTLDMFKTIVRKNGIRGLYRGTVPSCIKVVPACCLHYMFYENIKEKLAAQIRLRKSVW